MRVLALEQDLPAATAAAFTPDLLRAEARRVWELQQQDVIRAIYFRADRHATVLVLECSDTAEAERLLGTLPLLQAGLIQFELIPLAPYDGFARLFAG